MTGRPSVYTVELADKILVELASGRTLREVCSMDGMPPESTVRSWVLDDREGFQKRYASAREIGYQSMADEILEIADDGRNDWMERQNGAGESIEAVNHEHISRSRLRFDARRWLLSKALPKVYGDKLDIDQKTTHEVGNSVADLMKAIDGRTRSV